MLTEAQKKYLVTIPEDNIVTIQPFSEEIERTAEEIMSAAKAAVPNLEIRHLGASALVLSGQGDIDMYIFAPANKFEKYIPSLVETFGEPDRRGETSVKWAFEKNGFPVELYLTDPTSDAMRNQMKIFEILRDNSQPRHEYEALKEGLNGQSFRAYQAAKYAFYNELLKKLWAANEPEEDIITLAGLLKPGATVLDIGAYEGRHALYLANLGFQVTAVEPELASLQKLVARAKAEDLQIEAVQGSLEDYQTDQLFDAVVCTYVLHFLASQEEVSSALSRIQAWTSPGGYAAISAYTTKNPLGKRPYLFTPGGLHDSFRGWDIVYYKEQPTPWFIKPGETEMRRNHAVYLIAQKPMEKNSKIPKHDLHESTE